jgi:hypothetical protein
MMSFLLYNIKYYFAKLYNTKLDNNIIINNQNNIKKIKKKINILRYLLLSILISLISVLSIGSYFLLNLFEQQALNIDLDLLKQQFFNNFLNNINNKIDALDLLNVKFYTNINSYKLDTLLNVTLLSYEEFVTPLLKLTNTRSISFAPLVTNITRKGWEKYIITHPYNDDLFTKNWSLYKGIYNYSNNIASVHNNFIYGSKYPTYFFPIWQTSPYILTKNFIMLDIHTSFATKVIDTMILTKQSVISDIITLTIDYSIIKPISIIYRIIKFS